MLDQTPKLLSDSNSPQSKALQALDRWKPEEVAPLNRSELDTLIESLTTSLRPAPQRDYVRQLARLVEYTAAFGIPCQAPEVVQGIYREQLGDLPADLLAKAIDQTRATWQWSNRMPFPIEIRSHVAADLAKRKSLLSKAQVAKLKARDAETSKNVIPKEKWDELRRRLGAQAKGRRKTYWDTVADPTPEQMEEARQRWAKYAEESGS